MPLVANEICKAHGFTLDDIESWGGEVSYFRRLPGARLPDIEKGEADAIFDEAVRQWVDPGAALGMRFLEPEDEALAKLEALGMRRGVVLRSDFPSLAADFQAVDFSGFPVFTNEAVPDERVRALCAALEARRDRIPVGGRRPAAARPHVRRHPRGPAGRAVASRRRGLLARARLPRLIAMPELLVSTIRAGEVPAAASAMANAFADAPRFRFLVPNDAQRTTKLRWYWGAVIRASLRSGKIVQAAREEPNNLPLGVAVWEPPGHGKHSTLTLLRSGLWAAPMRLGVSAYLRRRSLSSLLAALAPAEPCWYLDAIGVDPSRQRSGLGTALLRSMLARVDDEGLPAFLDTSAPDNLAYYERFGFEVTAEATLPNGIPLWGMTRQPRLGRA